MHFAERISICFRYKIEISGNKIEINCKSHKNISDIAIVEKMISFAALRSVQS